jgi:hypothetical protein
MLPTFIVIGAMKCGTTSLYYYLGAHPEIEMSDRKETDFFVAEHNYDKGPDWYERRFPEGGRARGECSPNYTKAHLFPGVARRMRTLVPDARLVYMVRDPIDRIISHYVGRRAEGKEPRSFREAVTEPDNNYVRTSRYFRQLRPYREAFGDDQIRVWALEDLAARPSEVLRELHRFLGVDPSVAEAQLRQGHFNASARKRIRGAWFRWLRARVPQSVKDTLRPYVPRRWIPGTPIEPPEPSAALRERLADTLRRDVAALRAWTGQSFPEWSL